MSRNSLAVGFAGPTAAPREKQADASLGRPSSLHGARPGLSGLSRRNSWGAGAATAGDPGSTSRQKEGASRGLSVQVEDAVLDVYDLVYDQVVKGYSGTRRQELVAIQDTVSVHSRPPHRWAALGPSACPNGP